jgi:hypothetical protein
VNRVTLWILVSAIAAVFFGWQTYGAWTGPVLPGMEAPGGETFSPPAASPPKVGPGKASSFGAGFSTVVARPVFRPDRKPFLEGAADVPMRNYDSELAKYTVLGVLMAGDEKRAVVVSKGAPKAERWEVGAGDSLAGFTVKEVGEDGLILTADDREFTLPLYAGGPKAVGRTPLRTEVAPAPSPARRKPPTSARPAPGTGRSSPPSAASPNPAASPQQPRPVPRRIPRRTYPRRYTPGQR